MPVPVPRWEPSGLRERSGRPRVRSVRRNRGERESYDGLHCRSQECGHAGVILASGGAFEAGAGIDTPGLDLENGFADVILVQAAGEDDLAGSADGAGPVESLAGSAVTA